MSLQETLRELFLALQAAEPVANAVTQVLNFLFLILDQVALWLGFL